MALARVWVATGALSGLGAVAIAALAAHLPLDPAGSRLLASGAQMQGWHALALVLCGVWAPNANRAVHLAAAAFVLGMLLFCGDVYALALMGLRPGVAPAGGLSLMVGWGCLAASALKNN